MKIKEIVINGFKRFTDLKIAEIPESTRLVVLVGPNGSGKTSLLEAFNHWYQLHGFSHTTPEEYSVKKGSDVIAGNWYTNRVQISFHNQEQFTQEQIKGKFYFRTAYRNEPDFTITTLNNQNNPAEQIKLSTLMLNDTTVSENYQRLISQTLSGVFETSNDSKTVEELRDEIIGKIKHSLNNIFDDLNLSSIGDPLLISMQN